MAVPSSSSAVPLPVLQGIMPRAPSFAPLTTKQFIRNAKKASGQDIDVFHNYWIMG